MNDAQSPALKRPRDRVGRALDVLCRAFAVGGGLVLAAMALMMVFSIARRSLIGTPVQGDFELVQYATAIAVSMFLPFCQMVRGHIIVDFFTMGASERVRAALDAFAGVLLAGAAVLVGWRLSVGMGELLTNGDSSMILGVPTWYAYTAMVPSFFLLGCAALYTAAINLLEVRK
ncbi:MAG: TRAP transporter small permease [Thauera sp.]|jgi:TRAP-type C4-dicarboxylate transport system permease small subunit